MSPVPVCYFPTRRHHPRRPEPGAIQRLEAFGDDAVRVLDVSAGGARLATRSGVHVAERCHASLEGPHGERVPLVLRVVWRRGDEVGVALERPSAWWAAMTLAA